MNLISEIEKKFGDKANVYAKSKRRIYVTVARENAKELVRFLYSDLGARFSVASGVDRREGVEILYHMAFDALGILVSVRTLVPKPEPEMPSFTDFCEGMNWIERELHEMLGVNFKGHPGLERLLLPDDWQEGEYPFRKRSYGSQAENPERE